MRTKKQLGYEVSCDVRESKGVLGWEVWVQSAVAGPSELLDHILSFLNNWAESDLSEMSAEKFKLQKKALTTEKKEIPHTVAEEASEIWTDIAAGRPPFSDLRIGDQINSLDKQSIMEFFNDNIIKSHKLLCVAVIGKGSKWVADEERTKMSHNLK